jgi:N6-L-threonylcarbamoyladenine synthase
MLVLGIESTCDEAACSIVRDGRDILANVVSSQIDLHREYGGVVPELACRRHVDILLPVIDQALTQAKLTLQEIDLIAVAHGPGLVGALLIGLNAAKALSLALNKPFIGVNHVEAHLYAAIMSHPMDIVFPALGVVLSGGHTALVLIRAIGEYTLIGQTVDDAIGEAFDKVAKMLSLPYPGGPIIEKLAMTGDPKKYPLKAGKIKGRPLDFSFSGLKTGALYAIKGQNGTGTKFLTEKDKCDVAASFQATAFEDVVNKTLQAADQHQCSTLLFGGGVTHNQRLRQLFADKAQHHQLIWPSAGLSLDNAAMIAGLGYDCFLRRGSGDPMNLEALPRLPF